MHITALALVVLAQADAAPPTYTLDQVLDAAERQNLDLVVLRERLEQADANLTRAWTTLLPQAQVVGAYTRNSEEARLPFADPTAGYQSAPLPPPAPPGSLALIPNRLDEIVIQPFDQYVVQAQGSVPLIVMPAYYGIKAARRVAALSEASLTHARNELFFGIVQVYYGIVASQRVIELSGRQLEAAREQERVAQGRYNAGELAKVGFLRAGVERTRAEQDLLRAQNALASTQLALATLTGLEPPFVLVEPETVEPPAGSESELVDRALSDRKDLLAGRLAVEAADAGNTAAWWRLAPILTASAQYRWTNFAGFTGENDAWSVSVNAVWNIIDITRFADIDESASRAREATAQADKLERTVRQDVRTALLDYQSARANLVKAREGERLATESAGLVQSLFSAGTATTLDIVDANNVVFAAGVGRVVEELNVQLAALKLAKAIGAFGAKSLSPP